MRLLDGNYFRKHSKWCVSDFRKPKLPLITMRLSSPTKPFLILFLKIWIEYASSLCYFQPRDVSSCNIKVHLLLPSLDTVWPLWDVAFLAQFWVDIFFFFFNSHWLTLTRGLEAEGLEAPSEGGGVDDINTVLTLTPSVKSDSDDQKYNCHHPCSEAWIQGHITAVLHTLKSKSEQDREACFWATFCFCFLTELN